MNAGAQADSTRPIVLLHGCGGSLESTFVKPGWLDAIRAAGREPFPVHLPGHGAIPSPSDPAYYDDLAGLLLPTLPHGPFDAVGFSLGGKLLLELALRIPERIRRVVLGGVGDNVFAPERVGEAAAQALESGPTADTPPPILAFLRTWEPQRNDALAVAAVLRRPHNPVFTPERLRQITHPLLVVNGTEDPVGRADATLLAALPNVTLRKLAGIGHFDLPAQHAFIRHAIDFLQGPRS
jgi:pimeloyl-ACP methyl ester carboxylesterase